MSRLREIGNKVQTLNVKFRMNRGFSIIEIIVVIVMIGIMLGVALPKYNRVVEKSRQAEVFTNLAAIRGAQMRYYADTGEWASDWDDLEAEEPEYSERYFDYSLGSTADTVASAVRRAGSVNKNCCFGPYTVYVASSGRITKESASGYDSAP